MIVLISLALALLLAWFGSNIIKKHANLFYLGAATISAATVAVVWSGLDANFPAWVQAYLWPMLSRGAFATAMFIIVMAMGALPNGSVPIKRLIPIRAELSIMASFLILGHNVAYGKTYFVKLFTQAGQMPVNQMLAAICSLILIGIMLPLMITSFPAVRKKMKPKAWKKLQRTAYVFYALIYVHVMLLNVSLYQRGNSAYLVNIIVYSAVFLGYAGMRLRKAWMKKNSMLAKKMPVVSAIACVLVCAICCAPWSGTTPETNVIDTASENSAENISYADGAYFGSGKGYNGDITLAVKIAEGRIAGVTVVSTSEDGSYFEKAKTLIDEVIDKQSTQVDAVSGATYSSQGLKEAIDNALAQAAGGA